MYYIDYNTITEKWEVTTIMGIDNQCSYSNLEDAQLAADFANQAEERLSNK